MVLVAPLMMGVQMETEYRWISVKVEFCNDIEGEQCGELCCFNQVKGCPLDTGDDRCVNGNGHFRIVQVD